MSEFSTWATNATGLPLRNRGKCLVILISIKFGYSCVVCPFLILKFKRLEENFKYEKLRNFDELRCLWSSFSLSHSLSLSLSLSIYIYIYIYICIQLLKQRANLLPAGLKNCLDSAGIPLQRYLSHQALNSVFIAFRRGPDTDWGEGPL